METRVTSAALKFTPEGIVNVICATLLVTVAEPVMPVLPETVTAPVAVGTVKVTEVAELLPITAGVALPEEPLNNLTVISFPPQPSLFATDVRFVLTSTPDNAIVATVNVFPAAYQPSFIVEVIVVSQVIAT